MSSRGASAPRHHPFKYRRAMRCSPYREAIHVAAPQKATESIPNALEAVRPLSVLASPPTGRASTRRFTPQLETQPSAILRLRVC